MGTAEREELAFQLIEKVATMRRLQSEYWNSKAVVYLMLLNDIGNEIDELLIELTSEDEIDIT